MANHVKLKVLVVDNEAEFGATLAARLRLSKFETKSVYSDAEALATVAFFQPDVILLDLQMPDMTGLDVLALTQQSR